MECLHEDSGSNDLRPRASLGIVGNPAEARYNGRDQEDMDRRRQCGVSIIELIVTVAVIATVAAVSVPPVLTALRLVQLNAAARDVQSELQAARLKAVSANRPMRVRFDCPAVDQFRMVEVIGTPAAPDARDAAANRCSETAYPYPAADQNVLTRPNDDGPVRNLKRDVAFTASQTIEFWPDGTAHADAGSGNPWPAIAPTGVTLTVEYKTSTKSITVNGVGKVHIQ
jgi:type II secretory pathway pseudopilin PulG